MKTIKIKTTISGLASPQHPLAEVGMGRNCATYAVTEVPDETQLTEVIRLFSGSAIIRAPEQHIKMSELGVGKIIK